MSRAQTGSVPGWGAKILCHVAQPKKLINEKVHLKKESPSSSLRFKKKTTKNRVAIRSSDPTPGPISRENYVI